MNMKSIVKILMLTASVSIVATGCIKETFPQTSVVTGEQASNAPNAYQNFVNAITSPLAGQYSYSPANAWDLDFGYSSFLLQRDVLGQDIALETGDWFSSWYQVSVGMGPDYAIAQVPWTCYYKWIKSCNTVISLYAVAPTEAKKTGAGIAHAMRAMFYMDLARMFQYTYKGHEDAITVPIVNENTTVQSATNNPRATNKDIWAFILSDLDKAESELANYKRDDTYTPDVSVVYGLKARAYLTIEDWPNAQKYAKLAQNGYSPLTESEYLDRTTGFNTPNHAWMLAVHFKTDDPCIKNGNAEASWASAWITEIGGQNSKGEYEGTLDAGKYGMPKRIDAHLYSTIPDTDWRKKCFITPAADDAADLASLQTILANYSNVPNNIIWAINQTSTEKVGYTVVKFRPLSYTDKYVGAAVAVPLMRVEEMMLIEAEAIGMQNEANGITALTTFAKLRDPSYTYNTQTSFRNNVWWQRRVELFGEGFATFDIKRFEKGITRSYAGTNHPDGYRWNTSGVPSWMNLCIVGTETRYNNGITENNPTPVAPSGNSPEYVW